MLKHLTTKIMKKKMTFRIFLAFLLLTLTYSINAQVYPFWPQYNYTGCYNMPLLGGWTWMSSPPLPCSTNTLVCSPFGISPTTNSPNTNINENLNLNYNASYIFNNKFNYTNSLDNGANILKDNRSSSIDYFKDNDCDYFMAMANTESRFNTLTSPASYNSICKITVLKQDLSINWEINLSVSNQFTFQCDIIPQDIYVNNSSEILICGKIINYGTGGGNPQLGSDFAAKFSKTGILLWIEYYIANFAGIYDDAANAIIEDNNNNVFLVGQSSKIGSSFLNKPYILAINGASGALIDKGSLDLYGKYTDLIYIGNNNIAAVGSAVNSSSTLSDNDIICSIWVLNPGGILNLVKNNFVGETSTSTSPKIDECAWSVIKLGPDLIIASERKEDFLQSSTIISKLNISNLISSSSSPIIKTIEFYHDYMHSYNPDMSLIPVKLILPPTHPNKTSDHFSVVLNRYNSLTTSTSAFNNNSIPVRVPSSSYSTNPIKADAFTVFELDNNLNEITNGTFNWFEGFDKEPIDVSATNNYFEDLCILSLDNNNDNINNVFIRSVFDKNNIICNTVCSSLFYSCYNYGIYGSCIQSNLVTHSWITSSTSSNAYIFSSPLIFTGSLSTSTPTIINSTCSTVCNNNAYQYIATKILPITKTINNIYDFKNIIENQSIENQSTENETIGESNNFLIVSDILGRIYYNNKINNFEDLLKFTNNLQPGVYVIQLENNNKTYKYKFLK